MNFYLDARNILDMSLHVFPISVNLQRSVTSIIFDIIKLHYSLISRGHFTINNHYLSILVFSNLLTIDILGQLQSNSMNTLTEYPTNLFVNTVSSSFNISTMLAFLIKEISLINNICWDSFY